MNRSAFCLLLLLCDGPGLPAQDPGPKAPVPDLRPETALERIRRRNLFHPTRGLSPGKGGPAAAPVPTLVGVLITGKHRSALFRMPGEEEARFVKVGEELGGFRVKEITQNRVQLTALQGGDPLWVELDASNGTGAPTGGDVGALLALPAPKAAPKAPAPPASQPPTPPSPPPSRP